MADVLRHRGPRRHGAGRAIGVRLTGLVVYAGIVAWAWYQLPQTLPLVVPGAVVGGGFLPVVKGQPWLGLLAFVVIVVAVPLLLWPALGTGTFSDLTESFARD